jgi:hypothetical protein
VTHHTVGAQREKQEREREREEDRETHRERQTQRETERANKIHPTFHIIVTLLGDKRQKFPYPGNAFREKRGPL